MLIFTLDELLPFPLTNRQFLSDRGNVLHHPFSDHFFAFDSKVVFYATSALLRFEAIVRVLAVELEEEGENSVKVTEKRRRRWHIRWGMQDGDDTA